MDQTVGNPAMPGNAPMAGPMGMPGAGPGGMNPAAAMALMAQLLGKRRAHRSGKHMNRKRK